MRPVQAGTDLTRRAFLARSAAAGAGLLGLVGLDAAWPAAAAARSAAAVGDVRRFVSRPDLVPPVLTAAHAARGAAPGYLFLAPSSGPGQRGTLIVDDRGDPVWFRPTVPATAMNFRAAVFRGRPVLTWWQGQTEHGLGRGTHVVLDETYREVARLPAGHGRPSDLHEFLLTPRGTALVTSWERVPMDLSRLGGLANGVVVGGIVQELELPSGRVLFEWRSLDHVPVDESQAGMTTRAAYDYFHVNSVELDHDGNLLVSARNTWTIYKLDRGSGEIVWRLGGKRSDFAMGPGTGFAWQHDARRHGGGEEYLLSLFDDGAAPQVQPQSKALVLALDLRRRRAAVRHVYRHRPRVLAHALGSVQVLPSGNVLVGWGTAPFVTEYARDGRVLLDLRLPPGGQNYRALRLPWAGRPLAAPDLAARRTASRHLLYASWNGATEAAAWRLEAGVVAGALEPAGTVPRRGFETRLVAPAGARYAAVAALDRRGRPLRRSQVVRLD
jgi:hypothetical protein